MNNSKYKIDVKDLMRYASGRWLDIIQALIPSLSDAVSNAHRSTHIKCPFPERHPEDPEKKRFRLWNSNRANYKGGAICSCSKWYSGIDLLTDMNGLTFKEALAEVNANLGDPCDVANRFSDNDSSITKEKREAEIKANREKREIEAKKIQENIQKQRDKEDKFFIQLLKDTWSGSVPVTHYSAKPLWLYLKNRGINPQVLLQVDDLRFHPELEHHMGGQLIGKYPAMVCLYRDANHKPVSIHRTFLTSDGFKAELPAGEKSKRMMPSPSFVEFKGGAIHLTAHKRILSLTEGIETALAVFDATGLPTWPTFCDSMLARFEIPEDVEYIIVWADKDISLAGEKAAKEFKQRAWERGKACQIMLPRFPIPKKDKTIDWLDVLNIYGRSAFPKPNISEHINLIKTA
jgi:putative DNA primase/helicase